jgi:hypothetical protein
MLRVLRFGWGLFVVLLVVAGFSIHASNPSQAIPSQVMTFNQISPGVSGVSASIAPQTNPVHPAGPSIAVAITQVQ